MTLRWQRDDMEGWKDFLSPQSSHSSTNTKGISKDLFSTQNTFQKLSFFRKGDFKRNFHPQGISKGFFSTFQKISYSHKRDFKMFFFFIKIFCFTRFQKSPFLVSVVSEVPNLKNHTQPTKKNSKRKKQL